MATTAGSMKGRARFAAACGVLSQYVRAAAMEAEARPAAAVALPLMPVADVSMTKEEDQEPGPTASCASQAQMTIFYGGRVLVVDDVHADRAAELLRLAVAGAGASAKEVPRHEQAMLPPAGDNDMPMERKASLQRFLEKRRVRVTARATPYSRPDGGDACPDPDHLTLKL